KKEDAEKFTVALDGGDVHWLRGYCHLLSFMCEVTLAHDFHELLDRFGHVVFQKIETPFPFLKNAVGIWDVGDGVDIIDLIAAIHLTNFPVKEPERMQAALEHLEEVVAESRRSWKLILAEEDNDREWIPNPQQTSVMPGAQVTEEIVKGWHEFLGETELILQGKKLLPFWRIKDGETGVNLRKVFTNPQRFDFVLWFQGSAAAPFLEKGELTDPALWNRLMRVFQGQFIGFAIWFN
ncbi:MAG: hypothetical protein N2C14_26540, partial [Planctomycetales bacterium]